MTQEKGLGVPTSIKISRDSQNIKKNLHEWFWVTTHSRFTINLAYRNYHSYHTLPLVRWNYPYDQSKGSIKWINESIWDKSVHKINQGQNIIKQARGQVNSCLVIKFLM